MASRHAIARAARVLRAGGIVAYPTEGVYGLGCDPRNEAAVRRLLAIKRRPVGAGLILIARDAGQLDDFVLPPDATLHRRLAATWPGPVTWVMRARRTVPRWITGGRRTVAVRVTAHPEARRLCGAARSAIVSTSANRSGRPPARTALQVRRRLGSAIDCVLAGRIGPLGGPTEIRDAATGEVLRPAAPAGPATPDAAESSGYAP